MAIVNQTDEHSTGFFFKFFGSFTEGALWHVNKDEDTERVYLCQAKFMFITSICTYPHLVQSTVFFEQSLLQWRSNDQAINRTVQPLFEGRTIDQPSLIEYAQRLDASPIHC